MAEQVQRRENTAPATQAGQEQERRPTFVPDVDIKETPQQFDIIADMPGVQADDVDINLEGDTLTIGGTQSVESPEGYHLEYAEWRNGNYERTFTLGTDIDRENVKAKVNNGVLRLTLPKAKKAQSRKIPVSAE